MESRVVLDPADEATKNKLRKVFPNLFCVCHADKEAIVVCNYCHHSVDSKQAIDVQYYEEDNVFVLVVDDDAVLVSPEDMADTVIEMTLRALSSAHP